MTLEVGFDFGWNAIYIVYHIHDLKRVSGRSSEAFTFIIHGAELRKQTELAYENFADAPIPPFRERVVEDSLCSLWRTVE